MTEEGGSIEFKPATVVEPAAIVTLIQSDPQRYRISGNNKLRVTATLPTLESRTAFIETLLDPWLASIPREASG